MNLMYNLNKQGKIDFFCQQSKEVIVPWAQSPQQCFLRYVLPLAYLAYMGMCYWTGYDL